MRLRLVGGLLPTPALRALVELAEEYGDGDLHLTKRANLQLRGLPHVDGVLPPELVARVRGAGLLPSEPHDVVRNIMLSPLSGRAGGRADLRRVAAELDRLLLDDPSCARLAGRFLVVLDDGRGDLVDRTSDLAAVALDAGTVQVRAGSDQWGPAVEVARAAATLHSLASRFLDLRGVGPTAAWHVDELDAPLLVGRRDDRTRVTGGCPPYGRLSQVDGRSAEHVDVPDGRLTPDLAARLLDRSAAEVVVTPWRSVLLPDLEGR